jgi:hypothetical protein
VKKERKEGRKERKNERKDWKEERRTDREGEMFVDFKSIWNF